MSTRPTRQVPVLVDNSLNRAFALKYAIYAAFGVSGLLVGVPSFAAISSQLVAFVLAGVVAISSILASISVWHSVVGGIWVKRELYATIVMITFVGFYDAALFYLTIFEGSSERTSAAVISLALIVLPIWRIRHILRTNKR